MTDQAPQRAWRASCTFCGAPVEFRSAASPMAVCSYCRSTLVRDGDTLRRIGESATLFDDHSPLGLGARGKFKGEAFTLIGRIQLAYLDTDGDGGRWAEWHALFDNGRSGCLSEDNGAYVLSFSLPVPSEPLPDLVRTAIGSSVTVARGGWVLSSRVQVRVHAVQGELAWVPDLANSYPVVELRNPHGEVLSIEPLAQPPRLDLGQAVQLGDLALTGLPDERGPSQASVNARAIECPSCGAALTPTLDSTQSIVCSSCHSVVDIRNGLGKDLKFYRQDNTLEPLIPLGTVATLKVDGQYDNWQTVGYQERCDIPEDPEEEQTFWREYLLYNRMRGFAFLVDAQEGWSVVRPVTGVPSTLGNGLAFGGASYQKRYTYTAKTTYVLGEFYWPVRREQRTLNTDYVGKGSQAQLRLNREKSGNEITWSAGETMVDTEVHKAFRIDPAQRTAFKRDVSPLSGSQHGVWFYLKVGFFILLLIIMISRCSDDCSDVRDQYGEYSNEYRQCRDTARSSSGGSRGGSYGGYSSGGSHK